MNTNPIYIKTHRKNLFNTNGNCETFDELSEFVGIRFEYGEDKNGVIYIHYPTSLGDIELMNKKDKKNLLLNLFKSLKMQKNADGENKDYDNMFNEINLDKFPLYSYLWIWDDFKAHGRLIFNEYVDNNNPSGKINWKKTFRGDSFFCDDNIYYNDYIYRNRIDKENLLTEIYDYCVYKSLEMIFFMVNVSNNIVHPLYKNINFKRNEYKNRLKNLIKITFDDEKKLRFKHMLNIVDSYSFDELINKHIIGVSNYSGIYEREINCLLGNVSEKNDYYPVAFIDVDGKGVEMLSHLREDTLNMSDDECLIIDSKYYEFGNMPQTDSVEKQIVYGEHIEKNYNYSEDQIYNIFLIPRCFDDEKWGDKLIKYYGYSYASWKSNNKQYEKVLIYFIDLKYVVNNYRRGYDRNLFEMVEKDAKFRMKGLTN